MTSTNPQEESYVRTLHSKMFDQVWKWAGTYRTHEVSIGCNPAEIGKCRQLISNLRSRFHHYAWRSCETCIHRECEIARADSARFPKVTTPGARFDQWFKAKVGIGAAETP